MRKHINLLVALGLAASILVVDHATRTDNVASSAELSCLELPDERIDFGEVTNDDWDQWTGISLDFASKKEFLQVTTVDGTPALRQRFVPSSEGSARVVVRGELPEARTYTISQSVFFEPGFDWGRTKQTGKLGFGLGGGTSPTGGDLDPAGFTARFVWRGNGDGSARIAIYSYAADRTQNLPYGDDYDLEGFTAPVGQWFTLAMEVTANSAPGVADGRIRAWADDRLALDRTGIVWQDAGGDPTVDEFIYSAFYGGSSWDWAPESTTYVRFADVCWHGSASFDATVSGDVNCDNAVNEADVQGILEYLVGIRSDGEGCPLRDLATELNAALADASGDGAVRVDDALLLARGI